MKNIRGNWKGLVKITELPEPRWECKSGNCLCTTYRLNNPRSGIIFHSLKAIGILIDERIVWKPGTRAFPLCEPCEAHINE